MGPIILLFTLQMGKSRLGVEGLGVRAQGFELSLGVTVCRTRIESARAKPLSS